MDCLVYEDNEVFKLLTCIEISMFVEYRLY